MLKHHDQEQNLSDYNHGLLPAPALYGAAVYWELTSTGKMVTRYLPLPGREVIDLNLSGNPRCSRRLRRQVVRLMAKCRSRGTNPALIQRRGGGMETPAGPRCLFFTGSGRKDPIERTAMRMPA
jgi:hypothetical protein